MILRPAYTCNLYVCNKKFTTQANCPQYPKAPNVLIVPIASPSETINFETSS